MFLENRQVALKLPGSHLDPAVVPFLGLDRDIAVGHVLAEHPQHELELGGQLGRLPKHLGQLQLDEWESDVLRLGSPLAQQIAASEVEIFSTFGGFA